MGWGLILLIRGINLVTILTVTSFFIGHYMEFGNFMVGDSAHGMTMAFLTMSMAEIFHSFNMRSQRGSIFKLLTHNKILWAATIVSLIATTLVCEVPLLANALV